MCVRAMMNLVGVAVVDITPPAGLPMAGFAARRGTATDAHDQLTVRALVINDVALVTVDVIGIDASLSIRARIRCQLPAENVTIAATHTHGGPSSMPDRLSVRTDSDFMKRLESGVIESIDQAIANQQRARVFAGYGVDPGFAKNRRQENGPVDSYLPVIRFVDAREQTIAILTSYACHPVVLGADNLRWTADYIHFTRETLEKIYPGAVVLVATGCAGDVNSGHTSASSLSIQAKPERSFVFAEKMGQALAGAVIAAKLTELSGGVACSEVVERLYFEQREAEPAKILIEQWKTDISTGNPVRRIWCSWAERLMGRNIEPLTVRCTALNLCGVRIVALPGEIFAKTALDIRQTLRCSVPLFVLAYADDNPGYIPPRAAFSEGGYEVDEAHRYYGLGATFAPGSAERLADAGCKAARMVASEATNA